MVLPTELSARQVGGGEVADLVPGLDGGDAECDEQVGLAGAGRPDQGEVLAGADPLQAGEVVQGGFRDRGHALVELFEGLGHRERRGLQAGAGVGGVTGGDLGLDQGAQQLGCQLAHRGQLEPA